MTISRTQNNKIIYNYEICFTENDPNLQYNIYTELYQSDLHRLVSIAFISMSINASRVNQEGHLLCLVLHGWFITRTPLNIEKLAHFERDSRTDHRESVIEVGLWYRFRNELPYPVILYRTLVLVFAYFEISNHIDSNTFF